MKIVFVLLMSFLATGCASLLTDSTQLITFDSPDCPKATCSISNSKGSYVVKETPETIPITKSYGDLTIHCSKDEKWMEQSAPSSAVGLMWGNIAGFWLVGAAIDAGTGKGFEYNERISSHLKCE